jgi:hypothetical protein
MDGIEHMDGDEYWMEWGQMSDGMGMDIRRNGDASWTKWDGRRTLNGMTVSSDEMEMNIGWNGTVIGRNSDKSLTKIQ